MHDFIFVIAHPLVRDRARHLLTFIDGSPFFKHVRISVEQLFPQDAPACSAREVFEAVMDAVEPHTTTESLFIIDGLPRSLADWKIWLMALGSHSRIRYVVLIDHPDGIMPALSQTLKSLTLPPQPAPSEEEKKADEGAAEKAEKAGTTAEDEGQKEREETEEREVNRSREVYERLHESYEAYGRETVPILNNLYRIGKLRSIILDPYVDFSASVAYGWSCLNAILAQAAKEDDRLRFFRPLPSSFVEGEGRDRFGQPFGAVNVMAVQTATQ
ncbi:unnamed protein product [Vitrella brassicaformis CCMP3155]|uniref:Adenylate kinase n=1 Tax=Vitrella brassicaformis (strain CCMP3155) TaxID=1169540 RepID=A0A0G4EM62_VITBC|nr:unnamed protein product [Vitrella brassicaformis CCMP3155]|eukprot:CEL97948.1 unnamed protein product [Vitrella brassicaformis CCMP3155]